MFQKFNLIHNLGHKCLKPSEDPMKAKYLPCYSIFSDFCLSQLS